MILDLEFQESSSVLDVEFKEQEGYGTGYSKGKADGYTEGYAKGETDGYAEGEIAGKAEGYNEGYTVGEADGKQSEYDRFWDTIQANGTRKDYSFAFGGVGWNDKTFKPKYDMNVATGAYMFRGSAAQIDLVEWLKEQNVVLDTSAASSLTQAFYSTRFTRVGTIDISQLSATGPQYLFFASMQLKTIDNLIIKTDGSQTFGRAFDDCRSLENITITGTIGNDINFQSCPLTPESMVSILLHLKGHYLDDYSFTKTVYFSEECWLALNSAGIETPVPFLHGTNWRSFVETELQWNT